MKKHIMVGLLFLSICSNAQKSYKGAELYSTKLWKYGKMEVRMRMAKGSGILSTFFTYKDGSEVSGAFWEEVDIEVFGKNNAQTFQSNIISNNPKKTSEQVHSPGFSLGDDYHTYTLEWTPDYVAWYLDGNQVRKTQGGQAQELTNPESFRFNIWAADIPSWVGNFDTSALPAYQFINWIKYSTYTPGTGNNGPDFTLNWQDDFNTFNSARWGKGNWTFDQNLVDFDPANIVVKDGYIVLVLSKAGETGFTGTVPVDNLVTALEEENLSSGIQAFPNPTSSKLLLKGTLEGEWSLYDVWGKRIAQGQTTEIGVEDYPNGIYFLHVNNSVKRIVKK
jgi:beta-glucanase (GH16 family)